MASLVVFGGETITRTGQTAYLNDVWLYTPTTGTWREVHTVSSYAWNARNSCLVFFVCFCCAVAHVLLQRVSVAHYTVRGHDATILFYGFCVEFLVERLAQRSLLSSTCVQLCYCFIILPLVMVPRKKAQSFFFYLRCARGKPKHFWVAGFSFLGEQSRSHLNL